MPGHTTLGVEMLVLAVLLMWHQRALAERLRRLLNVRPMLVAIEDDRKDAHVAFLGKVNEIVKHIAVRGGEWHSDPATARAALHAAQVGVDLFGSLDAIGAAHRVVAAVLAAEAAEDPSLMLPDAQQAIDAYVLAVRADLKVDAR